MKTLVLMRHAKSSWNNEGLADFYRPLKKRGRKDADLMAHQLKKTGFSPDLIVSSSAERALQTANICAGVLEYPTENVLGKDALYEAGMNSWLYQIMELPDTANKVLMVGHNPVLWQLAENLSGQRLSNLPTSGQVIVQTGIGQWRDFSLQAQYQAQIHYPSMYRTRT